jgi:hypothetical protein
MITSCLANFSPAIFVLLAERALRQGETRGVIFRFSHRREIFRGERLQLEAALAGLHRQTLIGERERDFGIRHVAQNVEQLARRHGGRHIVGACTAIGGRGDLKFQIGGEERNVLSVLANEQIGQNRQRMATLDDATHNLQRPQQIVSLSFDQLHIYPS